MRMKKNVSSLVTTVMLLVVVGVSVPAVANAAPLPKVLPTSQNPVQAAHDPFMDPNPPTTATFTPIPTNTPPSGPTYTPTNTPMPTSTPTPICPGSWTQQAPYPIPVFDNAVVSQGGLIYSFGGVSN